MKLAINWNTLASFCRSLWTAYNDKGCRHQAAALTYMTLFAIVPTMTVVFTMFSLFPAFDGMSDQLQVYLFKYMLPSSGLEIESYLQEFTNQARHLSVVGVVMLAGTAYFMIKNIEHSFNRIWGVSVGRRGMSNFLLYWAVLSLGPLLLGIGLAVSTYLLSLRFFSSAEGELGVLAVLLQYLPWLLTTFGFTLLFAAVPNCRVPLHNALIGGFLTAVCFELFKDLFGLIVANSSYTTVYGTFAIVPVFLLWVYILWMIVLAGAVFVRTLSSYTGPGKNRQYPELVAALLALSKLHQTYATGISLNDRQILAVGLNVEQWQRLRVPLLNNHLLTTTAEGRYVLSRDLDRVTLRDLCAMIGVKSQTPVLTHYLQSFPWFADLMSRLVAIDTHTNTQLDVSVKALLDGDSDLPACVDEQAQDNESSDQEETCDQDESSDQQVPKAHTR